MAAKIVLEAPMGTSGRFLVATEAFDLLRAALSAAPQPEPDDPSFCPRDHGCSLPAGHDHDCELTAALCFCSECEAKADAEDGTR